ncbi:MAG TPA: response regulator [Terriglobales bacterium]
MQAIRPAKILAVDDNESHRYALERILRHAGFVVTVTGTARETLNLAKQLPDLIILDVNLPDSNGFEIYKSLKKDPATAQIPVIFLSASYDQSFGKQWARHMGAQEFLSYPILPDQLTTIVNGVLTRGATRLE